MGKAFPRGRARVSAAPFCGEVPQAVQKLAVKVALGDWVRRERSGGEDGQPDPVSFGV